MSTPALNPRPSARSTTTRVVSRAPRSWITWASSNQPATGRALTGGWSTMTSAMPSAVTVEDTLVEGLLMARSLPGLLSRMLTADGDDLTGHVRRVVTGEEHDDVGDLPRLGGPAERLLRRQLGKQLVARHLRQ